MKLTEQEIKQADSILRKYLTNASAKKNRTAEREVRLLIKVIQSAFPGVLGG